MEINSQQEQENVRSLIEQALDRHPYVLNKVSRGAIETCVRVLSFEKCQEILSETEKEFARGKKNRE
jgi:hypothetical protein